MIVIACRVLRATRHFPVRVARWPAGLAALIVAVTALLRFAPRRRQPGLSWLVVGGTVTVLAWLAGSALLAGYVVLGANFDETYGPLTAIMALLLWANVSGLALLAGFALAAQPEAVPAGQGDPRLPDTDAQGLHTCPRPSSRPSALRRRPG